MRILIATILFGLASLLVACKSKAPEAFSTNTEAEALMQVAFPGWKKDALVVTQVTQPDTDASGVKQELPLWVQVTPAKVATLSADRVLLIVAGTPSDAQGASQAGHSTPGNLGAYWFERREGRWYLAGSQPSFAWSGFFGDPGELTLTPLGNGQQALGVVNGSCWQGMCGRWLSLYALGAQRVDALLGSEEALMIESDASGATPGCPDLVAAKPGSQHRLSLEDYSTNYGCYSVSGTWQIQPGGSQPGDLVISFTGKQTSAQVVPIQAPAAPASAPASEPLEEGEAPPSEEYLVQVQAVQARLIYRFKDGLYRHASGDNPAPGF
ncbi:hypothetical protein [Uliginosibacterium sp. TH139]|uniref:hypothetical protein n=1 Tax=Uliginosibacterium sp. TH139 TaxID=2067453 RepID=UPI000C7CD005|nr:hypothetical protein [Uliginosibacterium sp. TH139]PLK50132.1 hypothetical protein C0V76_06930 [Uliginosibacterium sp. TH139]